MLDLGEALHVVLKAHQSAVVEKERQYYHAKQFSASTPCMQCHEWQPPFAAAPIAYDYLRQNHAHTQTTGYKPLLDDRCTLPYASTLPEAYTKFWRLSLPACTAQLKAGVKYWPHRLPARPMLGSKCDHCRNISVQGATLRKTPLHELLCHMPQCTVGIALSAGIHQQTALGTPFHTHYFVDTYI